MDRVWGAAARFLDGLWTTIWLAGAGLVIGGLLGLAIGTGLYVSRGGGILASRPVNVVLNFLVNFLRPIPFVLLAMALQPVVRHFGIPGIGNGYALVTIVFASTFGIARIVEQNLVSVDPGVLEAARAMGASRFKVVTSVLLPEALGPLILGFTFALVAIVDMTAIVGIIGADSLGKVALTYGLKQFNWTVVAVAILLVIIIVQIGQLVGNALARKVMRR
ncbi:methionine ABC transporter permease [Aeromicrobium sp. UC242_57]|uniref:methionine ABC transporter permease n=1 Tax=Aeromicrobium sp. UC242_57 TaxID=3374624 RepID=UPI0037B5DBFA